MMIQAVYFDLEGVLIKNHRAETERRIAQELGVTSADLKRLWTRYRRPLLVGQIKAHHYGQLLDEHFGLTPGRGQEVWRKHYSAGIEFDQTVLAVAERLRAHGCATAVLSNLMDESWQSIRDRAELVDFAPRLFSCETRVIKPELTAFQVATERLRLEPGKIVLVDDLSVNVGGAHKAGWFAVPFVTDVTNLSIALRRLDPLLLP